MIVQDKSCDLFTFSSEKKTQIICEKITKKKNYKISCKTVYCLMESVYCLMETVYCLIKSVYCLMETVYCLMETVYFLMESVYFLMETVYCLMEVFSDTFLSV